MCTNEPQGPTSMILIETTRSQGIVKRVKVCAHSKRMERTSIPTQLGTLDRLACAGCLPSRIGQFTIDSAQCHHLLFNIALPRKMLRNASATSTKSVNKNGNDELICGRLNLRLHRKLTPTVVNVQKQPAVKLIPKHQKRMPATLICPWIQGQSCVQTRFLTSSRDPCWRRAQRSCSPIGTMRNWNAMSMQIRIHSPVQVLRER